jgi:hypothetical protein
MTEALVNASERVLRATVCNRIKFSIFAKFFHPRPLKVGSDDVKAPNINRGMTHQSNGGVEVNDLILGCWLGLLT